MAAADGFNVSLVGVDGVNLTVRGLVDDGRALLGRLGALDLDPSAFGGIGSPVAAGARQLLGGQLSALRNTFSVLDSVHGGISFSIAGYRDADQQIATALGGTSTTGSSEPPKPTGLADDPAMMSQLAKHEGKRKHVYLDSRGHPTVGIGFNLDRAGARAALHAVGADYDSVRAGTQDLSDAQIHQLAHTDTQNTVNVVREYYDGFDQLDPARQRALVDMTFDLNGKINQFTGLHQALVDGDYDAAARHIAGSAFAKQTHSRGTDLADQMRDGGQ